MRRHTTQGGRLLSQTRALLRNFDLRARKRLGQHFLINEDVLETILETAGLTPADVVIEVGPGLGVLTRELVKTAGWVIAVELDDRLAALLKETFTSFNNITVINQDILQVEPSSLIKELEPVFPPSIENPYNYKLVANLPYYITSPVLRHFLEAKIKPKIMVIMVQKEVAQSIVAQPGDMSILSISVQFYSKPEIVCYVPASSFYPPPEVNSAILKVTPYPRPEVPVTDAGSFFEVVRAGFATPRKQIINSLAYVLSLPKAEALTLLEEADISPQRRAETLTLDEWARLWQVFTKVKRK